MKARELCITLLVSLNSCIGFSTPLYHARAITVLHDASQGGKIALLISYDGTEYSGWSDVGKRRQKSVSSMITECLDKLHSAAPGTLRLTAASRTDTGVHALGQVAHYEPPSAILTHENDSLSTVNRFSDRMDPQRLKMKLNRMLREDIVVRGCVSVADDFNAVGLASGKEYIYTLDTSSSASGLFSPLERYTTWHCPVSGERSLDFERMHEVARMLCGEMSFAAFRGAPRGSARNESWQEKSATCHLTHIKFHHVSNTRVQISVIGDRFVYHMVRIIIGTLYKIGIGELQPSEVEKALASGVWEQGSKGGFCAPAHGLVLNKVFYSPENDPNFGVNHDNHTGVEDWSVIDELG